MPRGIKLIHINNVNTHMTERQRDLTRLKLELRSGDKERISKALLEYMKKYLAARPIDNNVTSGYNDVDINKLFDGEVL